MSGKPQLAWGFYLPGRIQKGFLLIWGIIGIPISLEGGGF